MTSADHALRAALPDLPFDADGPVFRAPWEAQAFAMALALHERGVFTWKEWAHALSEAISEAQSAGDPDLGDTYYAHWLRALERIATEKGCTSDEALARRRTEWDEAARRTPHGQPISLRRELPDKTRDAYLHAIYRIYSGIDGAPDLDMTIGVANDAVAALMQAHGATQAVFVTAFNPFSRELEATANESRQRDLSAYIDRIGLHALPGAGIDPRSEWKAEASLFVLNATHENADALMLAFEQNAVVFVGSDGMPELLLHPHLR